MESINRINLKNIKNKFLGKIFNLFKKKGIFNKLKGKIFLFKLTLLILIKKKLKKNNNLSFFKKAL
jgi:hypothetical protein